MRYKETLPDVLSGLRQFGEIEMTIKIRSFVLGLPRLAKRLIVISVDVFLVVFSVWLAFYLRLGYFLPLEQVTDGLTPLPAVIIAVVMSLPCFIVFGLYRTVFRYAGAYALISIAKAVALYGLLFATLFTLIGVDGVPRTIGLIQPILLFILVSSSRFVARFWLSGVYNGLTRNGKRPAALIYGAGETGRELAAALAHSRATNIVGFLDDDTKLHGSKIRGLLVYNPAHSQRVIAKLRINEVLLALEGVNRRRRNVILKLLQGQNVVVRTLPSFSDLAMGRVTVNDIRELSIDDILGRDSIVSDPSLMKRDIAGKTVLVTGAGGSIGGELCRQIFSQKPKRLILFDHSEFALYKIYEELLSLAGLEGSMIVIVPVIGSAVNKNRVDTILKEMRPNIIFHSAAYKHVPLVEVNRFEGVYNNVFGTLIFAQSAIEFGVNKFVLISTDKAVRPTNVMGASKRVAELVLQALAAEQCRTAFAIVRFGNVLDSSGSVVPLFRKQIKQGGPVTVTHKDVTRYFMTISEAAQLVMQAGAMTCVNTQDTQVRPDTKKVDGFAPIYLLDMGNPVKIHDLACRMIELSGLSVFNDKTDDGDIEIKITGLRPGEKLYEELLIGDAVWDSKHPKIKYADERCLCWAQLEPELNNLKLAVDKSDQIELEKTLLRLVTGFSPNDDGARKQPENS